MSWQYCFAIGLILFAASQGGAPSRQCSADLFVNLLWVVGSLAAGLIAAGIMMLAIATGWL